MEGGGGGGGAGSLKPEVSYSPQTQSENENQLSPSCTVPRGNSIPAQIRYVPTAGNKALVDSAPDPLWYKAEQAHTYSAIYRTKTVGLQQLQSPSLLAVRLHRHVGDH